MYIKSLRVINVRSYKLDKVVFKPGINIIWGDVGSGKSSLLLALETTLFGLNKGDAKLLLRKGTHSCSTTVLFEDKGNTIEVQRRYKKKGNTVSQETGIFKEREKEIECAPQELDVEIVRSLFNSSSKNYKNNTFRTISYAQQGELKKILQMTSEQRNDVIRQSLGMNRYKEAIFAIELVQKEIKMRRERVLGALDTYVILDIEDLKTQLEVCTQQVDALEKKYNTYQEKLQYEREREKKIILLQEQIKHMIEEVNKNEEKRIRELEKINNMKKWCVEYEKESKEYTLSEDELKNIDKKQSKIKDIHEQLEKEKRKKEAKKIYQKRLELVQVDIERLDESIQAYSAKKEEELLSVHKEYEEKKEKYEISKKEIEKKIIALEYIQKDSKDIEKQKQNMLYVSKCPTCEQEISKTYSQHLVEKFDKKLLACVEAEKSKEKLFGEQKEISIELQELGNKERALRDEIRREEEKRIIVKRQRAEKEKKYEEYKILQEEIGKYTYDESIICELEAAIKQLEQEYLSDQEKKEKHIRVYAQKAQYTLYRNELEENMGKYDEKGNYEKKINDLRQKEKEIIDKKNDILIGMKELTKKSDEVKKSFEEQNSQKTKLMFIVDETLKKKIEKGKLEKELVELEKISHFSKEVLVEIMKKLEAYSFQYFSNEMSETFEEMVQFLIGDNIDVLLEGFSPVIEQNGFELDLGNLSGGEKSAIALGYRLALGKLLVQISKFNLPQVLILDEPTEGFSQEQINKFGKLLHLLGMKQIIIVSHNPSLMCIADHVIKITKEHHTSNISYEATVDGIEMTIGEHKE